jgi:hypothetical protein
MFVVIACGVVKTAFDKDIWVAVTYVLPVVMVTVPSYFYTKTVENKSKYGTTPYKNETVVSSQYSEATEGDK